MAQGGASNRRLLVDENITLSCEGHEPVDIRLDQMTPQSVARIFSLDPTTVWLREDTSRIPIGIPGKCFFPDGQNARFLLTDDVGTQITNLVALGSPIAAPLQAQDNTSSSVAVPTARPSSEPSSLTASPSHLLAAPRRAQSTNVKIVQAAMKRLPNGKWEFTAQQQTFVDVTEVTANLDYVSSAIQRKWGNDYLLVTADGLKVPDSGTTGLKFWKVGSRKLYAVKQCELAPQTTRKRPGIINISSSISDEEFTPLVKRSWTAELVKLTHISSELRDVKDSIDKIFTVNNMNIPVGLRSILYDTFKCAICQATPMTPPIIFAKCCKTIVGCQGCMDTWYRGDEGQSRTCPKCRSERAYLETCKLNGLDEFLAVIAPIVEAGVAEDSDDLMD